MRIYLLRFYPTDGRLRMLRRGKLDSEETKFRRKRGHDGVQKEELQPHQKSVFEDVTGMEDRMNIIRLGTISIHVFCTPRCYLTKSWEVGICSTYQISYLCGGSSPTSFDIHVLMALECVQVFLQQMEIREQSVGYFYLPDNLDFQVPLPVFVSESNVPDSCKGILQLICALRKKMMGEGDGMSITAMLAHLNLVRRSYFNDLHLDANLAVGTAHKIYLKLLGYLHGKLIYRLQKMGLILRQYYGHCPPNLKVNLRLCALGT